MTAASLFLCVFDKDNQLVEGECADEDHLKEIEIASWSWEVQYPAKLKKPDASQKQPKGAPGGGGDAGEDNKVKPSLFNFSKPMDKSSIRFLSALDTGEIFKTATFFIEEEFELSPMPFHLEIELKKVSVKSYQWSVNSERAGLSMNEDWSFSYEEIDFSYRWRKGGVIPAHFDGPPETKAAPTKSPLSADEQRAADLKRMKDLLPDMGKKKDK